jgi:hypothetical protein
MPPKTQRGGPKTAPQKLTAGRNQFGTGDFGFGG